MAFWRFALTAALAAFAATPAAAQPASVVVDEDEIRIRGCIRQASIDSSVAPETLVWSRSDIMLAGARGLDSDAATPVGTSGMAGRVFYWLDDEEDLSEHVGQLVEIEGELEDFEKGEIEVKRDGDFTEIELDLDGDEEKIRVPTSWLGTAASNEREVDIVARRIDVKNVRAVGPCEQP